MPSFDDNPFAEPSVDNPFAATQQSQPAIMRAVSPTPPPNYTRSPQQPPTQTATNYSTADFQRRQEELEALARMKEQLQQSQGTANTARNNNWPPLPAVCPMQPCFHHDIDVDIPPPFQRVVRHMYYLWLFHALVMMLNIVGGLALLIQFKDFKTFGLAILYFVLFTPVSFVCWYRPLYKAFRTNSSINFMMYFFIFFFQFVVTVIQAIGVPGSGTCGVLMAISSFDGTGSGIVCGVFILLIAVGFVLAAVADILLISKVHRIYRSTGASFAKAKQEISSELASNQHVREAATNAAAAAVNSQINSSRY
ncbi:secretory carrier membrane protein isoform X2 [Arctopsyche grandis]|uniref:secretory carrier membrane protein isoform X2 n=1 Tax=Arctopsyche grandis TaxID=121162 RepID=UPI00406D8D93